MMVLEQLSVDDLIDCSRAFDELVSGAQTMQNTAERINRHLYEALVQGDGTPACALVRTYKTHPFAELPPDLQAFATGAASEPIQADTPCLVLLASAGLEPAWNDTALSVRHRAIPLTSGRVVNQSPMISGMLRDFGLDVGDVVRPERPDWVRRHLDAYDLFYVPDVVGSPLVPAQDEFVLPYGVRSAIGFGATLPSQDLFAVVIFTVAPAPERSADLLRSLALGVKSALVPFTYKVFSS